MIKYICTYIFFLNKVRRNLIFTFRHRKTDDHGNDAFWDLFDIIKTTTVCCPTRVFKEIARNSRNSHNSTVNGLCQNT